MEGPVGHWMDDGDAAADGTLMMVEMYTRISSVAECTQVNIYSHNCYHKQMFRCSSILDSSNNTPT